MPDVFERVEKKYILNAQQRAFLEEKLGGRMKPDQYGESTIRNLYYDTPDYRLIRRSLEKPVYKEKLRVRSYRRVNGDDEVFVELKKKYRGIVYKRRITMKERQAMDVLASPENMADNSQIGHELEYFCRFYKNLEPKAYINYDRIAYFGMEDPDLRITFDTNIQFRTTQMRLTEEPGGRDILIEGRSLMEIKAAGAMPLWLVAILTEGKILPATFSKYGEAYSIMLAEGSIGFVRAPAEQKGKETENNKRRVGVAVLNPAKKGVAYG